MEERGNIYIFVFLSIVLVATGIRVYYSLTTPLLETDGSIALLNARVLDEKGIISSEGPSASILNAFLLKIFGESILVGKLGNTAASIGVIFLIWFFCIRAYNVRTALFATFFLAFSPLNILFSIMAKPYMMLSFLIILSAYLYYLGAKKNSIVLIVCASLCIPVAFGFRTFSIFSFLAAGIVFALSVAAKVWEKGNREISLRYPLIYIFSGLIFFTPLLYWRIRKLGLYFFRDFGMPDWLRSQDYAYLERWENVEHHFLDSAFIFLPVFLMFIYFIFVNREKISANIIVFSFPASFIFLLIINPGHHFPRILVPAIPFLCIMSAVFLDYLLSGQNKPLNKSLLLTFPLSMWIYMAINLAGPFRTEVSTSSGVMRMTVNIAMTFTFFYLVSFVLSRGFNFGGKTASLLVILILSGFAVDGIKRVDSRVNILSSAIMPYISAIEKMPLSGEARGILYENNPFGMLEGRDTKDLRNLALSDGIKLLSGDISAVSEKNNLSYFIIPGFKYADGIYYTYNDMSLRHNGFAPRMHEEMLSSSYLDRIYDNSKVIALFYPFSNPPHTPSLFTGRKIDVSAVFGKRGNDFTEVFFESEKPGEIPDEVVISNRSLRDDNLMCAFYDADTVIEAESFYKKRGEYDNPWFYVYTHWDLGEDYFKTFFYGNTAMVYPLSQGGKGGVLERDIPLSSGCYDIFAKISYKGDNYSGEVAEFFIDGNLLRKLSGIDLADLENYHFLGKTNIHEDKIVNMQLVIKENPSFKKSYLIFDRLVFQKSICFGDKDDNQMPSLLPLYEEKIKIHSGERKSIIIPEEFKSRQHIEFIAYNPDNLASYLLRYKIPE